MKDEKEVFEAVKSMGRSTIAFCKMRIHPAGWPFIVIAALVTVVLALVWNVLGWIGLVFTIWCIFFFRDPQRMTPTRAGLVVAPADGKVIAVKEGVDLPADLDIPKDDKAKGTGYTRVSIFLNVFDVHVNRIPISGTIKQISYHPGAFVNASLDKASEDNERSSMLIEQAKERYFAVVQIAGLVARRIICDAKEGDDVQTGQRYGIIRFGSRTDIYLPPGVNSQVIEGQTAIGGETVIADIKAKEKMRSGEYR